MPNHGVSALGSCFIFFAMPDMMHTVSWIGRGVGSIHVWDAEARAVYEGLTYEGHELPKINLKRTVSEYSLSEEEERAVKKTKSSEKKEEKEAAWAEEGWNEGGDENWDEVGDEILDEEEQMSSDESDGDRQDRFYDQLEDHGWFEEPEEEDEED